jgi:hypothetical protein
MTLSTVNSKRDVEGGDPFRGGPWVRTADVHTRTAVKTKLTWRIYVFLFEAQLGGLYSALNQRSPVNVLNLLDREPSQPSNRAGW